MERVILHCDMDNFYASVECKLNPELRTKYVAVCGNSAERHGIVLAKNQRAKQCGVRTGDPIWKARMSCPKLVVVPPHFDEYIKYSRLAKKIYYRFTDQVEPFGLDECWLDVSGSVKMFGSGENMARMIRRLIRTELGLTVSVGVAFNKIFAKLGSDLNKPDGMSVITREHFKEQLFPLPANTLLGVGKSVEKQLEGMGIHTIGQLAETPLKYLQYKLGVIGVTLWRYANGLDNSRVLLYEENLPIQSISHGITTTADLQNNREVWTVILELTQSVGEKLRKNGLLAGGVQIDIRDRTLRNMTCQERLPSPQQGTMAIARAAYRLFCRRYSWVQPVRAISVRAISLTEDTMPQQMNLFFDEKETEKMKKVDRVVDSIRQRFGHRLLQNAVLLSNHKMPEEKPTTLPSKFSAR